jgi:hypothetical protein
LKSVCGWVSWKYPAPISADGICARDCQHRHARPVAVEQAVDQVQVSWPAASGADRELSRQMRLGAGRKGGDLLVPDMDPFDLALASDRVGQPVEAVANDAVDPLDTGRCEDFRELIGDGFCHSCAPYLQADREEIFGSLAASESLAFVG